MAESMATPENAPRRRRFAAGDVLWRKGDASDYLYLITSGTVALYHVDDFGNETLVTEFGHNQTVGEAALYAAEARSTTVKAVEDVDALATDGDMLRARIAGFDKVSALIIDSLLAKMKMMATTIDERLVTGAAAVPEMDDILAGTSDLEATTPASPEVQGTVGGAARRPMREKTYRAGEVLWRKGDASDHVCLIASGTVAMYAVDDAGEESLITNLGRNDLVGENALYDAEPRSTNVHAVDEVTVLETDGRDLRARIARFDSVSALIIQNLLVKMKIMAAMLDRGQEVLAAARPADDAGGATAAIGARSGGSAVRRGSAVTGGGAAEGSPALDVAADEAPRRRDRSRLIAVFMVAVVVLGAAVLGGIGWRGGFSEESWIGRLAAQAKSRLLGGPTITFLGSSTEMVVINEATMYARPSVEATVITPLRVGSRIEVWGQADVDGLGWFRVVRRNGKYGYVPKFAFVRR